MWCDETEHRPIEAASSKASVATLQITTIRAIAVRSKERWALARIERALVPLLGNATVRPETAE